MKLKIFTLFLLLTLFCSPIMIVAANESVSYQLDSVKGLTWPQIWKIVNRYVHWRLEYLYQNEWYDVSNNLTIQKTFPQPNQAKITLIFTAPYNGDYRLTFAIKKALKQYMNITDNVMKLTYLEYELIFDWNDLINIPGIIANHGIKTIRSQKWFWASFRRNNVPKNYYIELDPTLTVTDTFNDESMIDSLFQLIVTDGHVEIDQYGSVPDYWWDGDFLSSRKLTIDSGDIDAVLTNFPVLVYLNDTRIDWENVQDDLDDIRFIESTNSTELKYEIDNHVVNDEAWFWVKIPSIVSGADTIFYLYYNNPSAVSGEDPENVWDNNYVMVQHMLDETTSITLDSTQYDNDGDKKGANEPIETVSGEIDDAQDFDGSDDYIKVDDANTLDLSTGSSLELWVYLDVMENYDELIGKENAYTFNIHSDKKLYCYLPGLSAAGWHTSTGTIDTDRFYYVVLTYSEALGNICFYIDGAIDRTIGSITGTHAQSAYQLSIMAEMRTFYGDVIRHCEGIADEVRVSDIARTAAWIKATYETGRDNLLDYGANQVVGSQYYEYGILYSINLLTGINVTEIISFAYNCSIEGSETISFQFSQDYTHWFSATDLDEWESASTGAETINIQTLGWQGGLFFYRANFTAGTTPELYDITVTYSTSTTSGFLFVSLLLIALIAVPAMLLMKKR